MPEGKPVSLPKPVAPGVSPRPSTTPQPAALESAGAVPSSGAGGGYAHATVWRLEPRPVRSPRAGAAARVARSLAQFVLRERSAGFAVVEAATPQPAPAARASAEPSAARDQQGPPFPPFQDTTWAEDLVAWCLEWLETALEVGGYALTGR